ncbi:NADH:flavin oxidoreductase/12-oxophytodienoate reductase [Scheffersomyces stipitis CBS 6054]|uniref:NADH:flavin oxidoreductase/12-oxophytodienoate reductase n=1 Tax=Scheffersomyces stipitis (strain ATCC 58785 / CBS 6054 / NBRC 10063 / NRRL Y-11545) TaxID=322104 RepID=A3LRT1_PICST|nr:NADH:flavin oxidoreductase/12-oxophytodienoate reductase [Scheffersomyces stipitis CBS 6054]ABN65443.2 NADH:flavin oxidoreductase/12-oxophytodienoate reductase [Scheffersomyces stipitis CBS 6054]KAG2733425.1 hypothetical protein G9P44_002950 [Scheffersomyces stipitis]
MTSSSVGPDYEVPVAKNVDYYSPLPDVASGTFFKEKEADKPPKIFSPLKIRGLTLPNRIGVSPMCQYSADEKFQATPFHLIHYGSILLRGPAITIIEASAVSPEGPLSPHDLGIFNDAQAEKLKPIVDFAHAYKKLIAIQLAHGGRKASGQPLFSHLEQVSDASVGGFPDKTVAPSAIPFRPYGNLPTPNEITKEDIKRVIREFGEAAKRSIEISGFDAIDIHAAHGYLIHEFYSAFSNKRTDEYGGSFENRIRFLLEVIDSVRSNIPESVPVFLRISASDNVDDPDAWTIEDSIKLAKIVADKGIDLIDVSSGGNIYKQQSRSKLQTADKPIHEPFARAIKEAVGDKLLVSCVANLERDPKQTAELIEEGSFDLALMGKGFMKNPGLVWHFADVLGVKTHQIQQYNWVFNPKREGIAELIARTEKLSAQESAQ